MEAEITRRINAIRKEYEINPLKTSNLLVQLARGHSCSMAKTSRVSHRDASGETAEERVKEAGIRFTMMGENVAMTENIKGATDEMIHSWMKSKGHRENILTPRYAETGVGVWQKGNAFYATQLFLRP